MSDIDDTLSKCKAVVIKTHEMQELEDAVFMVFLLENPTALEVSTLKEYLEHENPGIPMLVWRDSMKDVSVMSIQEARALRAILDSRIQEIEAAK